MRLMLAAALGLMLWQPETAMAAVQESCRLFVTAVLPGLFPYMVFSSMLLSRLRSRSPLMVTLLGWCGGSPTGAKLAAMGGMDGPARRLTLVATATMSPMFLVGTCGCWLGSPRAGWVLLSSVLAGGAVTGALAARGAGEAACAAQGARVPLSLGAAVEQAACTMLIVCGTMALWRLLADYAAELLPELALPVAAVLEVTCGVAGIAALPLPLALRTALIAGVTGAGGMAILTQNRVAAGDCALPLGQHMLWQAVHGGVSFLLALGLMLLTGQT